MQLIMSPASPFVRMVRVMLHETDQIDDVEEVAVQTTPLKSADQALAANPVGRIPSLIRPDEPSLYDSRVITRYLNDRAQGSLYPERDLWDVLTLEATGTEIMASGVNISYEMRLREEAKYSHEWIDAQWTKVMMGCTAIQNRWMAHLNAPLNMGQISVACALGYLDFRHDARNWRQGHGTLAAWFAEFEQRDSMVATRPS